MDVPELRQVLAGGESFTVEFKRARRSNDLSDSDIVEAVMCLANGAGGLLLLGVEDDGKATGIAPRHGKTTDINKLAALILNSTDPPLATPVELIVVDGQEVVVCQVPKSDVPVGTKNGLYKRRSLRMDGRPECVAYRPQELMTAALVMAERDYAGIVLPAATLDDLDSAEFDRFRGLAASGRGDQSLAEAGNEEILYALRLNPDQGRVTIGAVLLFGKPEALERLVPTVECLFQQFDGDSLVTNDSLRLPLLRSADELYDRLQRNNGEYEVMVGIHRVGIPRLPGMVAREAIANALVHRDYTLNSPIRVQLTIDELIVASPGGFPQGVTFDNLMIQSRPRSPIIADAFKRAGLVDRAGRGIPEMYRTLLRAGRDGPDYSRTTTDSVTVSVPTTGADLDMVRFIVSYENDHQMQFNLEQLRVLHELKESGASATGELAQALHSSVASVRGTTARLLDAGLLEERGHGRARQFHLSQAFYRIAEDRSVYIRVRGAEAMQQEQMVLSFVGTYGKITRAEAAELCLLQPTQARILLARLVDEGQLELRGSKRGSHYVAPAKGLSQVEDDRLT